MKLSNEDFEGRILKQQEENQCLRNLNKELEEQIKKLKEDKQLQDERFKKIHNNNNLLENKLVQIQKEASRLSGKKTQVEEEKNKYKCGPRHSSKGSQFNRKTNNKNSLLTPKLQKAF